MKQTEPVFFLFSLLGSLKENFYLGDHPGTQWLAKGVGGCFISQWEKKLTVFSQR